MEGLTGREGVSTGIVTKGSSGKLETKTGRSTGRLGVSTGIVETSTVSVSIATEVSVRESFSDGEKFTGSFPGRFPGRPRFLL